MRHNKLSKILTFALLKRKIFMKENKKGTSKLLIVLLFASYLFQANAESYYFYVQFTDKNDTPYSLQRPEEFLSERAINRRNAANILPDSTDLPVNPTYIEQVLIPGVVLHSRTRWLNGATVVTGDSALMSQIRQLPFVQFVQYTGKMSSLQLTPIARAKFKTDTLNYGDTNDQIRQLNGEALHQAGFTGSGIMIGVLDAGYLNTNNIAAFDSLRLQNRLVGAVNIVQPEIDTYTQHEHGTLVLSTMAAIIPELYIGTAPHASYLLIQTEYAPTEYLKEEDFWVAGIEYADSVGVDVVNSSLGYTQFDDASMNYSYADMNGTVSRSSRAAAMAAKKGILVSNSAGNSGSLTWKYIGAPADADGILAVGAVTSTGFASPFTSFGPTSDGRVKPDVSARGSTTSLVNTSGSLSFRNGTSFSSPLIAGLAACFLQYAYSELSSFPGVAAIREAIIASSSHFSEPDERLGYGIPDFGKAMQLLTMSSQVAKTTRTTGLSFEVQQNRLTVTSTLSTASRSQLKVFDASGRLISNLEIGPTEQRTLYLNSGIYIYHFSGGEGIETGKIIIP